jgi:DNA-binding transcriptional ArsR family regulator
MDPAKPTVVNDPRKIRALAHPARIAILRRLGFEGPATATECAEVTGLSPSACSYHLRMLAKYGFVEEDRSAAADGRERPWRVGDISIDVPDGPPALRAAGQMLSDVMRESTDEARARYRDHAESYPAEWRTGLGTYHGYLHVTPAELNGLRDQLIEMLAPYVRFEPADRPEGGKWIEVMAEFLPTFVPEEAS